MAWTTPTNVATGDVLTATRYNAEVVANTLAGGPIYATEALRDAAIPTPFEGQQAYITGSTETTAAGSTTYIPTGIQTIYNGTVWVTVTPTGTSQNATGATALLAASSVLTGSPGTVPTVTLRTGTTALVSQTIWCVPSTTNAVYLNIGSAATSATGVTGPALTFQYGASPAQTSISGTGIISGLTAGVNTFFQQYSVSSGSASIYLRSFTVQGVA